MIGKVYDKLTVLSYSHSNKHRFKVWNCKCECGVIVQRTTGSLNRRPYYGKHCGSKIHRQKLESAVNSILRRYKDGAIKRNIEFSLSYREVEYICQLDCHYCSAPPANKLRRANKNYLYNGIDRVNNKLGYIPSNIVPCCKWCNRMKKGLTYMKFIDQAKKISQIHAN